MYECATTTWAELMSQRNRMPVKMNEALASINTLFAYKIFFDCNQMKCLEISITNALQHLLQTQVRSPAVRLRLARCTAWVKLLIHPNTWHYPKNSYFPRILMQKLQKFMQTYDTILRILTSQGFWCKKSRNSQTHYTMLRFLYPRILMQKVHKFTQTNGTILRIPTSQGFWC